MDNYADADELNFKRMFIALRRIRDTTDGAANKIAAATLKQLYPSEEILLICHKDWK